MRSHTEWEGGGEGEGSEAKTGWEEKKERLAIASVYPHLYRHTTCFHHASCLDVVLINQTLWSEFSVVKHFALSTYVNEMVLLLFPIPQDPSVLAKLRCLFSFFQVYVFVYSEQGLWQMFIMMAIDCLWYTRMNCSPRLCLVSNIFAPRVKYVRWRRRRRSVWRPNCNPSI